MDRATTTEPGTRRVDVGSADGTALAVWADGHGPPLEREFEDVAAVVEAVAARTGGPVALWGHSYGAGCAMGGAALTGSVSRLVLYEPGLGIPYPAGSIEAVEAAVAAGDMERAALLVLVGRAPGSRCWTATSTSPTAATRPWSPA
jgi:alpha-beta hydrolase superfamily lysophospholipase